MHSRRRLFLLLLLFASACSTAPARRVPPAGRESPPPARHETAPDCADFSRTVHDCAARAGEARLGDVLEKIADCESGKSCGQPIDSRNGLYHGPFQFSEQTWERQCVPLFHGQHGLDCDGGPQNACCATYCAAKIIARGGIGNWPSCGKKALRKKRRRKA